MERATWLAQGKSCRGSRRTKEMQTKKKYKKNNEVEKKKRGEKFSYPYLRNLVKAILLLRKNIKNFHGKS